MQHFTVRTKQRSRLSRNAQSLFSLLHNSENGIAGIGIILVTMIVSLATLVVVNSTYSTFLSGRSVGMAERQIQAEYLLKSLVNFAAILIGTDVHPREDGSPDVWGDFIPGIQVPDVYLTALGMNFPGVAVSLEISPLNARIPLDMLWETPPGAGGTVGKNFQDKWKNVYLRLFQELGFDQTLAEEDHTNTFPNQVLNSQQLVDLLEQYQMKGGTPTYPQAPSGRGKIKRIGELTAIPGFTPRRVRELRPYVFVTPQNMSSSGSGSNTAVININVAIPRILKVLDPAVDSGTIDRLVSDVAQLAANDDIIGTQKKGTLRDDYPGLTREFVNFMTIDSNIFKVIGKVEFGGGATFFIDSIVTEQGTGQPAQVHSMHIY